MLGLRADVLEKGWPLNERLECRRKLIRTRSRPASGACDDNRCRVAADLGSARVYVRITGGRDEVLKGLEGLAAAGVVLARRIGSSSACDVSRTPLPGRSLLRRCS